MDVGVGFLRPREHGHRNMAMTLRSKQKARHWVVREMARRDAAQLDRTMPDRQPSSVMLELAEEFPRPEGDELQDPTREHEGAVPIQYDAARPS
jgi:hypothetical protein